ncbi:MAG: endonuclease III [Bacteroidales bacterium]|jgi:endonuclease-3|nr:endonuclease III [Bacteroidales bacterium]MDD2569817.1 endonuclease III [Bacteroidales bacterium]MDD2812314.1 endonuclease III [Bacteroidales bacterium]MDD3384969.1 endonuclease III [Bacteroidales bacterium]MDD3811563.1 endonuclease III [Bacteroidales bacterium]
MTLSERYAGIIAWFQENRPIAVTELHYDDPYQLMVAVILSGQCTDKRVNLITPAFFKKFPTIHDLASAPVEDVFNLIRSCSYPNNKTKHLIAAAIKVCREFNGNIPDTLENLEQIPGIGRKTANVILSVAFGKPALAVDTHVHRVSDRLGLTTKARSPLETEKQLVSHIPEELHAIAHHWLILHGRYICQARKPKCDECGLKEWCRYYQNQP